MAASIHGGMPPTSAQSKTTFERGLVSLAPGQRSLRRFFRRTESAVARPHPSKGIISPKGIILFERGDLIPLRPLLGRPPPNCRTPRALTALFLQLQISCNKS